MKTPDLFFQYVCTKHHFQGIYLCSSTVPEERKQDNKMKRYISSCNTWNLTLHIPSPCSTGSLPQILHILHLKITWSGPEPTSTCWPAARPCCTSMYLFVCGSVLYCCSQAFMYVFWSFTYSSMICTGKRTDAFLLVMEANRDTQDKRKRFVIVLLWCSSQLTLPPPDLRTRRIVFNLFRLYFNMLRPFIPSSFSPSLLNFHIYSFWRSHCCPSLILLWYFSASLSTIIFFLLLCSSVKHKYCLTLCLLCFSISPCVTPSIWVSVSQNRAKLSSVAAKA